MLSHFHPLLDRLLANGQAVIRLVLSSRIFRLPDGLVHLATSYGWSFPEFVMILNLLYALMSNQWNKVVD